MSFRRSYAELSTFLQVIDHYKSHIAIGFGGVFVGLTLAYSCRGPSPAEKKDLPQPPYPVAVQVYSIKDCNENKPVARAIMSDKRIELLSGDNQEGTSYTSVRTLEDIDFRNKKTEWALKKHDIESKIDDEKLRLENESAKKVKKK